jgi:hypothetical protein
MSDWQDMIVGDRMTVDDEFAPQVDDSRFSRQEWGLIMTATTFEIENPDDETDAELVADTSQLPSMIPELDNITDMGPMGTPREEPDSGGGLVGSIRDALGLGGTENGGDGVDEGKLDDAEMLVAAYAETLQAHLESEGRWSEVRAAAAEAETEG